MGQRQPFFWHRKWRQQLRKVTGKRKQKRALHCGFVVDQDSLIKNAAIIIELSHSGSTKSICVVEKCKCGNCSYKGAVNISLKYVCEYF